MANLERVRVAWTGFIGAPGVSTFHFVDATTALDPLYTFYNSMASLFPSAVAIRPETEGDIISDVDGSLQGSWSGTGTLTVNGGGGGGYAGPAGACVTWLTGATLDSRRVRGRTFLVPMAIGVYDSDGTLTGPVLATIRSACAALVTATASNMKVWHHPFAGKPAVPPKPARPAHDGGSAFVLSALVRDQTAVLRSRR